MATQTDVKAVTVAATGALGVGAARIKGFYFSMTTGGTITITDGGASGVTRLSVLVPIGTNYALLPGEGIWSRADPYVTFTTAVGSFTVFYG